MLRALPNRCYRLAVRTKDSQSLNRGSIPRSTTWSTVNHPSLYPLPTVVGELHLLLVELDAVAKDAEHGTRTHDIVVKALFLQRIVLRQTSFIDQIHRLLHRIADVLVIGSPFSDQTRRSGTS